jgi:hypothetical protein
MNEKKMTLIKSSHLTAHGPLVNALPDGVMLNGGCMRPKQIKLLLQLQTVSPRRHADAIMESCGIGLALNAPANPRASYQKYWRERFSQN